jgi:hypothetical protein
VRLSGSAVARLTNAFRQSSTDTLAASARPGTEALTLPSASAVANIVIQTIRVLSSSRQIVDITISEKSFVYPAILPHQKGGRLKLYVFDGFHNKKSEQAANYTLAGTARSPGNRHSEFSILYDTLSIPLLVHKFSFSSIYRPDFQHPFSH